MRSTIQLLFVILITNKCIHTQFLKESVLRIDRFLGTCEGKEHVPLRMYNLTLQHINKKIVVNCKIVIDHDVDEKLSVVYTMERCKNKEDLDSCHKYQDLKFPRTCDLISAKKQFWTPFMECIYPPLECPFKKGIHVVKNATFDAGNIFLPVNGWYWKTFLNLFTVKSKENIACIYVEGQIVQMGRKTN